MHDPTAEERARECAERVGTLVACVAIRGDPDVLVPSDAEIEAYILAALRAHAAPIEREREELWDWLRAHGEHGAQCTWHNTRGEDCTCGLAALIGEKP